MAPGPAARDRRRRTIRPDFTGDATTAPGVLDSIAASIGPVPRVLLRDTAPGEEPGPIVRPPGDNDDDRSIRYRIDGEIARGGMGAVLKGRDPDLGRDVALKVLRDDLRDDADMVRRFVEEAQIGGQLQHPGIVPIYELGTFADLRPFFAMKLVKGHTLAQLLEARDGPDDDRPRFLSIFEAIAQTVAYAHARGVIHRDLKPSNVMVGSFGEVQVMDWGLAKVLPRGGVVDDAQAGKLDRQETVIATARSGSDEPGLSHAGSVMGTPSLHGPRAGPRRGRAGRRAGRRLRAGLDPLRGPHRRAGLPRPLLRRDPPQGGAGRPGRRRRPPGRLRGRRRAGRHRPGLPGARGGGPPAARRRRGRAGHGLSGRRAGPAAHRRDRPRRRGRPRRGGRPHRRRGQRARRVERRARRFQVGLAASLLVLTTVGGLGLTYLLQQRQQRAARFGQVLAEATALRDRARREAGDPGAWRDALAALERAEGQGPEVEVLRDEIQAGLEEAERDARLRQELVEVRANQRTSASRAPTPPTPPPSATRGWTSTPWSPPSSPGG